MAPVRSTEYRLYLAAHTLENRLNRFAIFCVMLPFTLWVQSLEAQDVRATRIVDEELCILRRSIDFEATYFGEVFTNTRGGISTKGATQYAGLLDLLMTIDFDR